MLNLSLRPGAATPDESGRWPSGRSEACQGVTDVVERRTFNHSCSSATARTGRPSTASAGAPWRAAVGTSGLLHDGKSRTRKLSSLAPAKGPFIPWLHTCFVWESRSPPESLLNARIRVLNVGCGLFLFGRLRRTRAVRPRYRLRLHLRNLSLRAPQLTQN